jgi:CRISPR locus-related DNA-binding protein
MEEFININHNLMDSEVVYMKKVLIATLYSPDPVLLASNRLGADRLILLLDKKPNAEQEKSYKLIKESIGRVVDVKTIKTEVYNIVEVAKKCVEIIDMQPKEDKIFINITSGRKTKALGLLFASYTRSDRIEKIAYNPEEDKNDVIYLPKLCFRLNESQRKILDFLDNGNIANKSYTDIAEEIGISRAMLYKTLEELKNMDFVKIEGGLKITDGGKIARL